MAVELGNMRAACRAMCIHPWTYRRWKRQPDRYGAEILRPHYPVGQLDGALARLDKYVEERMAVNDG